MVVVFANTVSIVVGGRPHAVLASVSLRPCGFLVEIVHSCINAISVLHLCFP